MAYVAGIAAHPAFTDRFLEDFAQPGLRIPVTANAELFSEVAEIGRTVIWLHTFGERFIDATNGRPSQPPRLSHGPMPHIPAGGALQGVGASMPDEISYNPETRRLSIGSGYIEEVSPAVWEYEVSGKKVIRQWFSYRKADRERPVMGDRRPPSRLGEIQPERWLAEYTTELLNVIHVLGRLVELERMQEELLERVCNEPLIPRSAIVTSENPHGTASHPQRTDQNDAQHELMDQT